MRHRARRRRQVSRKCLDKSFVRVSHRQILEVISSMNVLAARVRNATADETDEQFFVDRSSSLLRRTAAVAAAATAEAEAVDREARFPKAAIDAARQQQLLGVQI